KTSFIRVCQPLPCARNQARTSASTRNAICSFRTGSGKPRCAIAFAQSSGAVRGASFVNRIAASGIALSFAQSVLPLALRVARVPGFVFMLFRLSGRDYLKPARKCVEGSREPKLSAQWVDANRPSVPRRLAQDSRAGQRILCGTIPSAPSWSPSDLLRPSLFAAGRGGGGLADV